MLTAKVRVQVILFVVIALAGITYVGWSYVGLGRLFGGSGYRVTVSLADSGGIFTNAEVTYRGVPVGRVGDMRLSPTGIDVDLQLDSGTDIPDDVDAVIADRSAVGEQYVDLRPRRDGGPFLRDGSAIPVDHTQTPLPVTTLLTTVDGLASSVPTQDLNTVVTELDTALQGAGPDLQVLLDTSSSLTTKATQHLPQTTALITDGKTVLRTQNEQSAAITSFGESLVLLSAQLKDSDADLRKILTQAPQLSSQLSQLIEGSQPELGVLVANLLTTADLTLQRAPGLEELLVSFPQAVSAASDVIRPDGIHLGLALEFYDPVPCVAGYQGTPRRTGGDTGKGKPLNTDARCTLPPGNATGVRGSQNAPTGPRPVVTRPDAGGSTTFVPNPADTPDLPMTTSLAGLLGLPG
ncbi:MCE family protein [Labedaea rhizosphaerae]|uniref:Phospholipid/cholesterol/gamma-HCH transport system substrate-binding protein n=1 Tax=Labedaea rhizosphaerae TaxID=598644 RepID=A0A4R6S665_LABRH|nr:MlaD family protein [Labedaea rhizosphaerae]TDP95171.1 phospholipid/cholesterol/gamma-HCH transport system substrate-binding protein [Labedaea rhizosphaerae]